MSHVVIKSYEEVFKGTVQCPMCQSMIPEYEKKHYGVWYTREVCTCGYERPYNFTAHGGKA